MRYPQAPDLSIARIRVFQLQVLAHSHLAQALAEARKLLRWWMRLCCGCNTLPSPPRPGDTCVSTAWLEGVLNSQQIASVRVEGLDGNRGLVGAVTRLIIAYFPPPAEAHAAAAPRAPPAHPPPRSLVLKMTRDGVRGRQKCIGMGMYREAWVFLRGLLPSDGSGQAPRVYYAWGSWLFSECVVLMEDVKAREGKQVVGMNVVMGDQIWGDIDKQCTSIVDRIEMLETMFIRAAEQHAKTWMDPRLLHMSWLKASPWYLGRGRGAWEVGVFFACEQWQAAKAQAADPQSGLTFSPTLVSVIDRSFTKTSWERLQRHLKTARYTLAHGDFHAANHLLVMEPSQHQTFDIVLVDWSEVGPWSPEHDLAQMIISDVKPQLLEGHPTRKLLAAYYGRLRELGVVGEGGIDPAYTFDACYEAFCDGGMERWIWVFAVLAAAPTPVRLKQYFHDQLLAFHKSHGDKPFYVLKSVVPLV